MWQEFLEKITGNDFKSLARCISLIENEVPGYEEFLQSLPPGNTPVIGITGPPGAGKSTLTDALIHLVTANKMKVAVLCVDPSSPFNLGALLGDRIRMSEWYNSPNVFIRSLATRGSLGGLHPKIIEITDVMKVAGFDLIIIETVGVGQSEIEIAGLAEVTLVVLVPESGDDVQSMKAGLMEIADIFIVNKSDRPGAAQFIKNLSMMVSPAFRAWEREPEIIKTVATTKEGIEELLRSINKCLAAPGRPERKYQLLAEKAYQLIRNRKMKDISRQKILEELKAKKITNVYAFAAGY